MISVAGESYPLAGLSVLTRLVPIWITSSAECCVSEKNFAQRLTAAQFPRVHLHASVRTGSLVVVRAGRAPYRPGDGALVLSHPFLRRVWIR